MREIAETRKLAQSTVISHLAVAYENGEDISIEEFVSENKKQVIVQAFKNLGLAFLAPVKEAVGPLYTWEELKLVRAQLIRKQASF